MPGMDLGTQAAAHIPCGHQLCFQQPTFLPGFPHAAPAPVQAAFPVRSLVPTQLRTTRLVLQLSHHPPASPAAFSANLRV